MAIVESRVKNGSLVIGGRVFSCVPTAVSVVPGSEGGGGGDSLEVLCGDVLTAGGSSESLTAELSITALQDFTDPNGLVAYSWLNQGEQTFEWIPNGADPTNKWVGKVVVTPIETGGEVNTRLTSDVSWTITALQTPASWGTPTYVIGAAPKPTIGSITPATGAAAGSEVVTITGTEFTGATGVTFDGDAGTAFSVVSSTEISVTTPAHSAGAVDVVVQHPNGDATSTGGFTYS